MNELENPQAFPCLDNNDYKGQIKLLSEGMTLRDYFAAKAMQSIHSDRLNFTGDDPMTIEESSELAYQIADSMLKARNKNK